MSMKSSVVALLLTVAAFASAPTSAAATIINRYSSNQTERFDDFLMLFKAKPEALMAAFLIGGKTGKEVEETMRRNSSVEYVFIVGKGSLANSPYERLVQLSIEATRRIRRISPSGKISTETTSSPEHPGVLITRRSMLKNGISCGYKPVEWDGFLVDRNARLVLPDDSFARTVSGEYGAGESLVTPTVGVISYDDLKSALFDPPSSLSPDVINLAVDRCNGGEHFYCRYAASALANRSPTRSKELYMTACQAGDTLSCPRTSLQDNSCQSGSDAGCSSLEDELFRDAGRERAGAYQSDSARLRNILKIDTKRNRDFLDIFTDGCRAGSRYACSRMGLLAPYYVAKAILIKNDTDFSGSPKGVVAPIPPLVSSIIKGAICLSMVRSAERSEPSLALFDYSCTPIQKETSINRDNFWAAAMLALIDFEDEDDVSSDLTMRIENEAAFESIKTEHRELSVYIASVARLFSLETKFGEQSCLKANRYFGDDDEWQAVTRFFTLCRDTCDFPSLGDATVDEDSCLDQCLAERTAPVYGGPENRRPRPPIPAELPLASDSGAVQGLLSALDSGKAVDNLRRRPPFAMAAASAHLAAAPGTAHQSSNLITERKIPPEYERVHEFLEFLKQAKDASGAFEPSNAPRWDSERLLSFMSSKGVASTNVNRGEWRTHQGEHVFVAGKLVRHSLKEIRSAVAARKGEAFNLLAHVGHIYAQPYRQYSELRFEPKADGVVVHIADLYSLTFERQTGELRLVRIDYLQQEGE